MAAILFFLLIGLPIAELYVIVQVSQGIGVINTLVILLAVSIAGAWLLKQQGMATWMRLQETLARGEMPGKEVTDGAMILFGGALLLTPGFVTDAVGLVLLLPPTRAALKGATRRLFRRWAENKVPPGVRIYRAGVVRTQRKPGPTEPRVVPPGSPRLPSEPRPNEGDSPDRG
ncbi:MAG: hypothetical protein GEU71_07645 [Actinobacteria bacterium]|nr:hypothetical protein [Actinomycetota bacterium]